MLAVGFLKVVLPLKTPKHFTQMLKLRHQSLTNFPIDNQMG